MKLWIALTQSEAVAESLRTALSPTGLLYDEPTVDDTLRRLVTARPDAIIVDDGAGLGRPAIERLIAHAPGIPLLALVARPTGDYHAAHLLAGARETLDKPFEVDDLNAALERICAATQSPSPVVASGPPTWSPSPGADLHRYRSAMRWLARATASTEEPVDIARRLCETAVDLFDAARGLMLLHMDGRPQVVASHGIAKNALTQLHLEYHRGFLRCFELEPVLLDRRSATIDEDAAQEMDLLSARLALPVVVAGRTCGALLLGDRSDGLAYGTEDRELLTLLVRGASACLESAQDRRASAQREDQQDTILSHINSGVVAVDSSGHITLLNASAEHILQLSAVEVVGQSVQKLGSAFADVILRTLRDQNPRLRSTIRDVAIRAELGVSVTPLGDDGAVAVFARLEDQTNDEDPAYSPIWQYLSSRLAQEIKNPMVAISTFSQLLPKKHASKEFREEFSEVVQREVDRINHVVSTLYEFANNPRLNVATQNLNERVEHCLKEIGEKLGSSGIELDIDFTSEAVPVELDVELFEQALTSVLQNSIEAMPDGGTLRVRTRRSNGTCALEVADTGSGISDQDAPHIFMPFYSTKEKGLGLGLTLARRIVQEHNGTLDSEVPDDAGSRIVIQLPATPETDKTEH